MSNIEARVGQQEVTDITIARSSSGSLVLSQESINEDATHVVVELKALPFLIATLKTFLPTRKTRSTK